MGMGLIIPFFTHVCHSLYVPSLISVFAPLFGIHTMNESSLFRVVFAAVLSFHSYSILGLGFIQEIGTTTHQIKYQRVIHIPTQGSMGMVDPNQKVHEKNHLYRVRNDQGQILAPIFGRSAGAPQ